MEAKEAGSNLSDITPLILSLFRACWSAEADLHACSHVREKSPSKEREQRPDDRKFRLGCETAKAGRSRPKSTRRERPTSRTSSPGSMTCWPARRTKCIPLSASPGTAEQPPDEP